MKKIEVINIVTQNYRALEAVCDRVGLERMLDRLLNTCERQEREHLAFGARLLRRAPRRQQTIRLTAMFFAVKCVVSRSHYELPHPCAENVLAYLAGCREDYQIGAMLAAAIATNSHTTFAASESFAQLDYVEHFAASE